MIIKSLLSQDLYKLTMLQVFYREFPEATAKYRFKCRNKDVNLLPFKDEINAELDELCKLQFTYDELNYLYGFPYFDFEFINYLKFFKLNREDIMVSEKDGNLDIVMEGLLTQVSMFEIFVLKIVHEVYSINVYPPTESLLDEGRKNLIQKILDFKKFVKENGYTPQVCEFGGRRAYTTDWHYFITKNLVDNGIIIGTSDVDLARRLNIKPIGSQAHEYIQTFQVFTHPMESQKEAFKTWVDFYGDNLNILLSDTLGDKLFLLNYDRELALKTNVRHDSGCPFQFGEMMITHYKALGIDPKTKTIVFSDGLNFPKMFELEERFHGRIQTVYGIGTNLTNHFPVKPLQNVIKQVEVNGYPTCKLSNNINKSMTEDIDYFNYLKSCLDKI